MSDVGLDDKVQPNKPNKSLACRICLHSIDILPTVASLQSFVIATRHSYCDGDFDLIWCAAAETLGAAFHRMKSHLVFPNKVTDCDEMQDDI